MKKSFLSLGWIVLLTALLSSCSDGDTIYKNTGDNSASVTLEYTDYIGNNEIYIEAIPNEKTARFELAVGKDEDRTLFVSGSLGNEEFTGNQKTNWIFTDLEEDTVYTVFARAYNSEGEAGEISILKVATFNGDFIIEEQFVSDTGFAVTVTMNTIYRGYSYGIITDESSVGNFNDWISVMDPLRPQTYNVLDAQPSTDYYFIAKAESRLQSQPGDSGAGDFTKIFIHHLRTKDEGDAPRVDFTVDYIDYMWTDITYTPNDLVYEFRGLVQQDNVYDPFFNVYDNDIARFMLTNGVPIQSKVIFSGGTGSMDREPNKLFESYICCYNSFGEVENIQLFQWSTPEFDPSFGTAEVEITILSRDTEQVTYGFEPNEHTAGFWYESWAADPFDQDTAGMTNEEIAEYLLRTYMTNDENDPAYYYYSGGNWAWKHQRFYNTSMKEYWPNEWKDVSVASAVEGLRVYGVVLPMNGNGVKGIGKVTMIEWSKPL